MTAALPPVRPSAGARGSRGWSLVELMVGLLLGLIVTAAAGAAFHGAQAAYGAAVEHMLLEQRGQFALDVLAQQIRHSGWNAFPAAGGAPPPPLIGHDDCGQPGIDDVPTCGRAGIGASDALLLRFAAPSEPDPAMTDCSGFPVASAPTVGRAGALAAATAPSPQSVANLFYIAAGTDGEPQLLCRYRSRRAGELAGSGWTSGALVSGVETMQFRYGVDTGGDGKADAYLRADEVAALGRAAWGKVLAVQIALVLRSQRSLPSAGPTSTRSLALLPPRFSGDSGADIAFVPVTRPEAMRRVFATTVRLRNAPRCEETLC